MLQFLKFLAICLFLVQSSYAARLPSPCPNLFTYEGEPEWDRWYGVITFSANIELVELNYKILLDRPSQLLVSWDGEVRSDDNINYSVFDPFHTQRANEVVKLRIMVKFNPLGTIPSVIKIIINGNTMCSINDNRGTTFAPPREPSTTRFDPSFNNEEDNASEYGPNIRQPSINNPTYNPVVPSNNANSYRPSASSSTSGESSHTPVSYGSNQNSYNYNQANVPSQSQSQPIYSSGGGTPDVPSYSNSNPSSSGTNPNYGTINPVYSGSQNNFANTDINPASSGFSNSPAQSWSETQTQTQHLISSRNNVSSSGNQQELNSNGVSGPVVTTLNVPSNSVNKNNIDQIVQLIKTQLEQQQAQGTSTANKTVIVALVTPVNNNQQQAQPQSQPQPPSSNISHTVINISSAETSTLRTTTTTTPPTSSTSRVRSTASTPKQSNQQLQGNQQQQQRNNSKD